MGDKYNKYFADFSPEALRLLLCYKWPGNVRELENTIESIVVLATSDRVTPDEFPENIRAAAETAEEPPLSVEEALSYVRQALRQPTLPQEETEDVVPFEEVEKRAILDAIRRCEGDISKASRKLGLSRATIYRKLEKYGIR
jgi:two-component system response regulator HydG